MATVNPTFSTSASTGDYSIIAFTWAITTANFDGAPIGMAEWADVTWTATGTWGTATLKIQGSADKATFPATGLSNAAGGAEATFTTDKNVTIIERPLWVRPILTVVGSGASITVTAQCRRANPLRT